MDANGDDDSRSENDEYYDSVMLPMDEDQLSTDSLATTIDMPVDDFHSFDSREEFPDVDDPRREE